MAAIVIDTARGLPTLDTMLFKAIWSWLDPDGATPGAHRAVARWCVGDPFLLKYVVHDIESAEEHGAATEIQTYRLQYSWHCHGGPAPGRCELCYSDEDSEGGGPVVDARLGVVNPRTYLRLGKIPNTQAASDWIGDNMDFDEMRLCIGCVQILWSSYELPRDIVW